MIEININDEDFMNIVNEVFEEMEADIIEEMDGESSNNKHKNQLLSDESDCISDCSEDFTKISEKIVDNSQISALSVRTKQCATYFYYSMGGTYAARHV